MLSRTLSLKELRYPITSIIIKRSVIFNHISVINYYTFIVPKEDILNRVLNDKEAGLVVQMLDDIFNYYLYGYPKIPIELVKNN